MKIAIFDIDNTLTESRSAISGDTAKLLSELVDLVPVAIVSGESMEGFDYQVISHLSHSKRENLFALPTGGAELQKHENSGWKKVYSVQISDDKRKAIFRELSLATGKSNVELLGLIEDRGSLITYAALGKDAPLEKKYAYDPTRGKRRELVEKLRAKLPGVNMSIGGSTSMDFTEAGVDKAYGVRKLLEHLGIDPRDAVFVGDATTGGGNDEPVKTTGVKIIPTSGPKETNVILARLVREASGMKKEIEAAYFCAEYALGGDETEYAGGLGVLAADLLIEAGEEGVEFAAIGMAYEGSKLSDQGFSLVQGDSGAPLRISVPIEGRKMHLKFWEKRFGTATLYLVDPDVEQNELQDRYRGVLYDRDFSVRIRQQVLIGVGGYKLLAALGIEPRAYHINEGNMAFAALAVLAEKFKNKSLSDTELVKAAQERIVSTKHTILPAGVLAPFDDVWRFIGSYCGEHGVTKSLLASLGTYEDNRSLFSATKFLLSLSGKSSAVSVLHARFEKEKYPSSKLFPITNGVHRGRWQSELFRSGGSMTDEEMWRAKSVLRSALRDEAAKSGVSLDPDICTVVWARRFVPYKRPFALFEDSSRLKAILSNPEKPLQIVISGKVYAEDPESKAIEAHIRELAADPEYKGRIAYVPGYSIELSKKLVQGADIWLNTPIRGIEACGTSGMKAGLNGALEMSISDGWVGEVDWRGIGWVLSDSSVSDSIYEFLEREALPAFYKRENGVPKRWVGLMRATMGIVESGFTAARMLKDYRAKLYGTLDTNR